MLKKGDPGYDAPGFLVRAVKQGYYGLVMREPGDVFRISFARHFADVHEPDKHGGLGWMEKIEGEKAPKRTGQKAEARGARPPPADPSERDAKMAQMDRMAEEAAAEDQAKAEADVI